MMDTTCACWSSASRCGPCGGAIRSTGAPTSAAAPRPNRSELTAELAELARRAADAIGAPVAGVDLLPGRDGELYAIEVNAVPGWQALSRTLQVDIARHVLDYRAIAGRSKARRQSMQTT